LILATYIQSDCNGKKKEKKKEKKKKELQHSVEGFSV